MAAKLTTVHARAGVINRKIENTVLRFDRVRPVAPCECCGAATVQRIPQRRFCSGALPLPVHKTERSVPLSPARERKRFLGLGISRVVGSAPAWSLVGAFSCATVPSRWGASDSKKLWVPRLWSDQSPIEMMPLGQVLLIIPLASGSE